MLAALAHAHARGVVHRDVKPANILLGPDGRARLSDFGVARLSGESRLTLTGGVVGTVAYMAPEQARGEGAGPASDVYSACLVVYEGLAGANPVAGGSPAETARRAAAGAVPPLARARPDLPKRLCAAIEAGLARDPAARPSAREMADHLAEARGGLGPAARRRGARALPVLASAAGGAALAGAGLAAADGQLAQHLSADWQRPGVAVAAIVLSALAFAWRPRAAAALAVVAGSVLVGLASPAAAAILGAVALAVAVTGWRTGRLLLLPAAAPALFAIGLGPLYPAIAGLVPRWPARLWAAVAGMVAALGWQVAAGAGGLLAGGAPLPSAVGGLDEGSSPADAGRALWDPLADRPEALVQAAALVAAAMCVPLVLRARPGRPAPGGLRRLGGGRGGRAGRDRPGRRRRRGIAGAGRGDRAGVGHAALARPPAARAREGVRYAAKSDRMSLLRDIEQKIEGLFERSFRRAFRSSLQPVELARKLAREMEDHKTVSVSRVYVPNEFTVYLAPQDRESFATYEQSLTTELAAYLDAHARTAGLSLVAPPTVSLLTDSDLRVGEFGISCRMAEAPPAEPEPEAAGPRRGAAAGGEGRAPPPAAAAGRTSRRPSRCPRPSPRRRRPRPPLPRGPTSRWRASAAPR